MAKIIRHQQIVEDAWIPLFPAEGGDPADVMIPPAGDVIVPVAAWLKHRQTLVERGLPVAVWLGPADDPATIASSLDQLAFVAIHFPVFRDGRGYSTAALLRTRYGYRGELRAIGDVLRDQMFYLHRVGFDSFAVRADRPIDEALQALQDFSEVYQAAVVQPIPLFRRRLTA